MSDTDTPFARWLRQKAAEAGYPKEVRGSVSRLAKAAGIDVGQTSRALEGKAVPNPDSLRQLARAVHVSVIEMFIEAGVIRPEDINEAFTPDGDADQSMYSAPSFDRASTEDSRKARGRRLGVPEKGLDLYVRLVERIERGVADELKDSTTS
jgi:transcriptional regulator with XRE-family HTH domain